MALNFPSSPTIDQVYTDSTSGFSYKWNGSVWISNTATETVIKDGSITPIKLSTGGPSWNISSDVQISGIATASSFVGNLTGTSTGLSGTPNLNVGIVTSSSFVGNLTGNSTGLSGTPNVVLGITTASSFVGNLTGTASTATAAGIAYSISGSPDATFGTITATTYITTSDKNLKDNIQTINGALEKLSGIRGVSFEWKSDQTLSMGVIAQEVEEVFPELVKDGEVKAVNYDGMIGVLIEAVKELQQKVDKLENTK